MTRAPAGPAKDAARGLAARLVPALIAPDAIPHLLTGAGDAVDPRYADAAAALVAAAARADPSLAARAAPALAATLAADDARARTAALAVVAAAGGAMRDAEAGGDGGSGATVDALADALAAAARDGPPHDARAAVAGLAAVLPPTRQPAAWRPWPSARRVRWPGRAPWRNRAKRGSALATLAAVGAASPTALAPHVGAAAEFVTATLLRAPPAAFGRAGAAPAAGGGGASTAAALKGAALEDLASALVPAAAAAGAATSTPPETRAVADALVPDLVALLDPDPAAARGGLISSRRRARAPRCRARPPHPHCLPRRARARVRLPVPGPGHSRP